MAIDPPEQKRKRKRKLRTADHDEPPNESKIKASSSQSEAPPLDDTPSSPALKESESEKPSRDTEETDDFASFYLRQVATEFQDDLDKIRSAADFKDSSIPILVNALRQGQSLFSDDEKNGIMGKSGKLEG